MPMPTPRFLCAFTTAYRLSAHTDPVGSPPAVASAERTGGGFDAADLHLAEADLEVEHEGA